MHDAPAHIHPHFSEHREAGFDRLADQVIEQLHAALQARGQASMVISGGSTPVPLFQRLAKRPLAWDRVWITLADERWVAPDQPDSNERLARTHLLVGHAAVAHFVSLWTADAQPMAAESQLNQRLAQMPHPFDVVLLGMGGDGHTASLFPGGDRLTEALTSPSWCCAIQAPGASQPRMTLTPRALLPCGFLALLITGAQKRTVLAEALEPGSVETLPIRVFLKQTDTPVHVYWAP